MRNFFNVKLNQALGDLVPEEEPFPGAGYSITVFPDEFPGFKSAQLGIEGFSFESCSNVKSFLIPAVRSSQTRDEYFTGL